MKLPEPDRNRFDIRGRFCGVSLRIHPLFWSSVAVLGVRYCADPEGGSLGYFAFWIFAVLGCVLLHTLAQIFVGRLFGMRGEIILYGLGSQVLGVESLCRCWQRALVLLAGPTVQLVLLGGVWGLTAIPFPKTLIDWGWQTPVATGALILVQINLTWGLLNIVPLWPFVGGRIAVDVGETALGKTGRVISLVLSLAVTSIVSVLIVLEMSLRLNNRFDPGYLIHLEEGIIRLLFCFVLWTISFKALWPVENSLHEPVST